ncbi:MAG: ParM/StbA family protein [Novibacillus thermophilus]
MKKIAIDPGYGYVKGIDEFKNAVCFPSLVAPAHDRSMEEVLSGVSNGNSLKEIEIEYEDAEGVYRLFVGDLARESRNATYSFDRNKVNHLNTRVLIATTAAILSSEGDRLWVGVGLPFEYFKAQGEEMKRLLMDFNARVRFKGNGYDRKITFDRVSIYAQGATSIYDALLYPNGAFRYPELMRNGSLVAMVNWGTRTADVVVFKSGRDGFRLQSELSFTLDDVGAMEIRRMVQRAFHSKVGAPISVMEAEDIINDDGIVFYDGIEYDFSNTIEDSKRHITRKVLDSLQNRWGNKISFIRKIFFAGGTTADVGHLLRQHPLSKQIHIVEDPQLSEARGMLQLMEIQQRQDEPRMEQEPQDRVSYSG